MFSPLRWARRLIRYEYGLDYVAEYIVGMRDMHHVIDVLFDRSDKAEMQGYLALAPVSMWPTVCCRTEYAT
jgi:hypothetical protein